MAILLFTPVFAGLPFNDRQMLVNSIGKLYRVPYEKIYVMQGASRFIGHFRACTRIRQ
jgi:hypothetical protein